MNETILTSDSLARTRITLPAWCAEDGCVEQCHDSFLLLEAKNLMPEAYTLLFTFPTPRRTDFTCPRNHTVITSWVLSSTALTKSLSLLLCEPLSQ